MSVKKTTYTYVDRNRIQFTPGKLFTILLGVAICSFGVYNIHLQSNITEGGILGLILLLNYWSGTSVSILSPLLDILAYALALRYLGKDFLKFSVVATLSLAGFFRLWEQFPPVLPDLSDYPLVAAIAGGIFIGIGAGLIIRQGISASGDDALAMAISKITRWRISYVYFATDITILVLSLTYIPLRRIGFSLLTVIISSLLIDFIQNVGHKKISTIESLDAPVNNLL